MKLHAVFCFAICGGVFISDVHISALPAINNDELPSDSRPDSATDPVISLFDTTSTNSRAEKEIDDSTQHDRVNRLHLPHGPAVESCEAMLAPKFEDLAVNLEEHAHEHEQDKAMESAHSLRVEYLELMNKCVADHSSFAEDELESALLQVDQKWGVIKKHIIKPIKKHVVDPVKKHVVDPATKWVKNGPPAPPAGNPPKTYTSWKAVQQALALAAVVYQDEEAIDYFMQGCPDTSKNPKLHAIVGKVDQKSLDTMRKYCPIYRLYKKIAFLDNGKSVNGKDVGTEALILETHDDPVAELELAAETHGRKLLSVDEATEDVQERAKWGGSRRRRRRRWHAHLPHRHHIHVPHRHHIHVPHIHVPHRHHIHVPHRHHIHVPHRHHKHHKHHKHTPAPKYAVKSAGTPTKPGVVWLAFRGSEEAEDWKANLKFTTTSWPDGGGGRVHYGFYTQYAQIRKTVFKTVDEKVAAGWVNFHVTGHSLGGAIAELVAMALAHRHPNVRVQMINFGAPGVGDKHWVSAFNSKIKLATRIVNNKDIVTCLPGHNPVSGIASRVGNLFTRGSASNPYTTNVHHFLEWSNNAWRAKRWPSCSRCWSIGDHSITQYSKIVIDPPYSRCEHSCYNPKDYQFTDVPTRSPTRSPTSSKWYHRRL